MADLIRAHAAATHALHAPRLPDHIWNAAASRAPKRASKTNLDADGALRDFARKASQASSGNQPGDAARRRASALPVI